MEIENLKQIPKEKLKTLMCSQALVTKAPWRGCVDEEVFTEVATQNCDSSCQEETGYSFCVPTGGKADVSPPMSLFCELSPPKHQL